MNSPSTATDDDPSRADIGLVCALSMELNHFFDRCERVRSMTGDRFRFRGGRLNEIRVAAVESGAGPKRAERATHALLDGHHPNWVIACGFSGALRDGIGIGDIIVADAISYADHEIAVPHGLAANPANGLHVGRFVTTDAIVHTVADKRQLADRRDSIACDMESYAVAVACREAKVPFMAVRVVTDDLSADLPAEVHALLASTGAGRLGATVGALWNRPESVKDLWKLRENATKAARRLAPFLASVIEQLHEAKQQRTS